MIAYLLALRALAQAREAQSSARTVGELAATIHHVQAARNVCRMMCPPLVSHG